MPGHAETAGLQCEVVRRISNGYKRNCQYDLDKHHDFELLAPKPWLLTTMFVCICSLKPNVRLQHESREPNTQASEC